MYHDLSGGFAFDNGVKIRLGVDNLFDEQPPVSLTNLNINYDISEEHKLWVIGLAIGRGF